MNLCQKVVIIVGILSCLGGTSIGCANESLIDTQDSEPDRCIVSIVEKLDIDIDEPEALISYQIIQEQEKEEEVIEEENSIQEEEIEIVQQEEKEEEALIQEKEIKEEEIVEQEPAAAAKTASEPESSETTPAASADLRYMSAIIFAEAGNQCEAGQQAVGIVVQNRSDSSAFANGIYNVIYQKGQFTPVSNGALNSALNMYDNGSIPSSCIEAARYALAGNKTVNYNGSTIDLTGIYYFSRSLSNAKFTIQSHQFK